ncbi:MAG: hypothetical protein WA919_15780 [Coleofasciculaceae cyanobacterium]
MMEPILGTVGNYTPVVGMVDTDILLSRGGIINSSVMSVNNAIYGTGQNYINNVIYGTNQDDLIVTGNSNDTIFTAEGNNHVASGGGNDTIYTGSGNDYINAGTGINTVWLAGGDDTVALEFAGITTINNFNVNQTKIDLLGIEASSATLIQDGQDTLVGLPHLAILARIKFVDVNTVAANSVDIFGAEVGIFTA